MRSSGDDEERTDRLLTTGEHPFFVVERDTFVPVAELALDDTVWLASGSTAQVTDIQVERGPPDAPFTTHNIEVEGFHTYFVGDLGVWVHNASRAACERAFSVITQIKDRNPGISHWDAFVTALDRTNTPKRRATFDSVLDPVAEALMEAMYKDAVTPGGIDLAKVRSVVELKQFREAHPLGYRLRGRDLEFHHTATKEWTRRLLGDTPPFSTFTEQQWSDLFDEMPGLIVEVQDHRGGTVDGISSFHRILEQQLPKGTTAPAVILERLEASYTQWDPQNGLGIWAVAREWLRQKGVQ